jgi:hypothetical protein
MKKSFKPRLIESNLRGFTVVMFSVSINYNIIYGHMHMLFTKARSYCLRCKCNMFTRIALII